MRALRYVSTEILSLLLRHYRCRKIIFLKNLPIIAHAINKRVSEEHITWWKGTHTTITLSLNHYVMKKVHAFNHENSIFQSLWKEETMKPCCLHETSSWLIISLLLLRRNETYLFFFYKNIKWKIQKSIDIKYNT